MPAYITMYIIYITLFIYVSVYANAAAWPNRDADQETTALERSFNRANIFIKLRTANGRMILLVCQKHISCQKLRQTVPQLIKEFNTINNYSNSEVIHYYYYYTLGKEFDLFNDANKWQLPTLVYVLALKPYYFKGDINNQTSVTRWIQKMDEYKLIEPTTLSQANNLLETDDVDQNCTKKYILFLHDEKKCPSDQWPIIARVAYKEHGITAVRLKSPVPPDIMVALFKRMPELDINSCQNLFLINQESYSVSLTDHVTEEISFVINELSASNNQTCPVLLDSFWYPILPPLSELQIQYFSEEHVLVELEHRIQYVLIGVAGGCAVCTLAFSIFWGLNGGAFAK